MTNSIVPNIKTGILWSGLRLLTLLNWNQLWFLLYGRWLYIKNNICVALNQCFLHAKHNNSLLAQFTDEIETFKKYGLFLNLVYQYSLNFGNSALVLPLWNASVFENWNREKLNISFFQIGIRHQLRVCGVNRWIYWLQFFLGDMLIFAFPCLLTMILIPAFDLKGFNTPAGLGSIFLLLLLYNSVAVLFSYFLSFAFNKWETVQNVIGTVLVLVSMMKIYKECSRNCNTYLWLIWKFKMSTTNTKFQVRTCFSGSRHCKVIKILKQ